MMNYLSPSERGQVVATIADSPSANLEVGTQKIFKGKYRAKFPKKKK